MSTLELLIVIVVILWLLGAFAFPVGSAVHVLLVVLLVLLVLYFAKRV